MKMGRELFWVGGAIGVATNALSLAKLVNHFFEIGIGGVPKYILDSYTDFIADLQYWLIELPFKVQIPELAVHATIVWVMFAGSNLRFLTSNDNGAKLYRSLGDVGRGERAPLPRWLVVALNGLCTLIGPLFSLFIFAMWLGNRQMGPTGLGHWGDRFMISNRYYTLRLSRLYLLILALAPICAALLLAWGAAGELGQ